MQTLMQNSSSMRAHQHVACIHAFMCSFKHGACICANSMCVRRARAHAHASTPCTPGTLSMPCTPCTPYTPRTLRMPCLHCTHARTHGAVQKRPCMMHMHKMLSLHSCPFCRRQTLRDRWTISSPFPFIGRISPAPCSQEFTRIAPQARIAGRGHSSRETNAWNHSDLTFANGKRSTSDYEVLAQPSPQDQGPSCRSCTMHPALTCPIALRTSFGCSLLTSCCLRAPMMFDS